MVLSGISTNDSSLAEDTVRAARRWFSAGITLSVVKRTQITERVGLDFNVEFFNIFNRVQFAPPGESYNQSTINTPLNLFGVVTAQQNQPRLIQLALRLSF